MHFVSLTILLMSPWNLIKLGIFQTCDFPENIAVVLVVALLLLIDGLCLYIQVFLWAGYDLSY